MKSPRQAFRRLLSVLAMGCLCSCSADSLRVRRTTSLDGVEETQFTAAVVTEQLHSRVTARLDGNSTREMFVLIAHGHPPKVNKAPNQEVGYVPTSYIASFSGTKSSFHVTFFGRCESCIIGHTDLDFGDADAKALSALIDPKHLWVY